MKDTEHIKFHELAEAVTRKYHPDKFGSGRYYMELEAVYPHDRVSKGRVNQLSQETSDESAFNLEYAKEHGKVLLFRIGYRQPFLQKETYNAPITY